MRTIFPTIYCLHNTIEDKYYVGMTLRNVGLRWVDHVRAYANPPSLLSDAMHDSRLEDWTFRVVLEANFLTSTGYELMLEMQFFEKYFIDKFNSIANGYNSNRFLQAKETEYYRSRINEGFGCNPKRIIFLVSDYFRVPMAALVGPGKQVREICDARQVAMALIKDKNPEITSTQIGKIFSGRGRSSVLNGIKHINDLIDVDTDFGKNVYYCKLLIDAYIN